MIEREYYRLDRAADLAKCTVEDLIHFGATEKLPIYLLVEGGFHPKLIYEISHGTSGLDFRCLDHNDPLYKIPILNPLRVQSLCLKAYESRSGNVSATFDWIRYQEDSCDISRSLIPDRDLYLHADNMVIMAEDLPLLTDGGGEKPIRANVERSMLQLIIGMAMAGYGYDPTAKKSPVVAEIAADLARLGIPLDDGTVRTYLQKAATHLPQNPRKS